MRYKVCCLLSRNNVFLRFPVKPDHSFSGIVPKFQPMMNQGYSKIPGVSPMFNPGQKGMTDNTDIYVFLLGK